MTSQFTLRSQQAPASRSEHADDVLCINTIHNKGGPNGGVFLQITADEEDDLPIPGHAASFGVVEAAQARGDFDVLAQRGRRALRVHLKGDVDAGLAALEAALERALG